MLAYGLLSRRLERRAITPPMVFVALGIVLGPSVLGLVDLGFDEASVRILAEATLVLVLFTDAIRIDVGLVRSQFRLPLRLLGIGLPLTVVAGTAVAYLLFDELGLFGAALLAAILAPTDAALGQAVVSSEDVPRRVRQVLNVESGLNDGIALPLVTLFIALAGVEEAVRSTGSWVRFVALQIGVGVLVGVLVGAVGGRLVDTASRRGWTEGALRQLSVLALPVIAFGASTALDGNGFIAAFVAGVAFGSVARDHCPHVHDFTEDEAELLTLLTFLAFGAAVVGPALGSLTWQIALYAVLSLTAIRMLPVALSLAGSGLHLRTVAFVGWFGPRGLASILFALLLVEEASLPITPVVLDVVTWTVLLSILAHGLSAVPLARAYGRWFERARGDMAEEGTAPDLVTRAPGRDARTASRTP